MLLWNSITDLVVLVVVVVVGGSGGIGVFAYVIL
jgi:hypothetical protein